ncbi:MAG TPA: CAP domain-containing protein [Planctomycetota bacterium]|nr:CAP domain-containing protein [Planctomycetota bacterium]
MTETPPPTRARPLRILAYAVLGIVASAGVLILLKAAARPPAPTVDAPPPAAAPVDAEEARRAYAELKAKADKANPVTDALIAEIYAAGNRWNPVWAVVNPADQESPFDTLAAALVNRRAETAAQAFGELTAEVDAEMRARKYGPALEALAKFRPEPHLEEARRALVHDTLARIDSDLAVVEEHGTALVDAGRFVEASRWYSGQAGRFRGTDRHGRVASRPDQLSEVAVVDDLRRRRETAEAQARSNEVIKKIQASVAPAGTGTPSADPAAPPLGPFHAKLAERVNQKRFAQKKYTFGAGITGSPTEATAEGVIVGGLLMKWPGIPADVLFAMAGDSFHGEDWVVAAEYAFAAGHPAYSGGFLWRYAGGADRKQRQATIDEILARFRGLRSVPEGGFTYDLKAGWEDRSQRANRTAVDEAGRHAKALLGTSEARRREEAFEKLRGLYLQPGLADETREKVRATAVDALTTLKRERLEDLAKRAKATGGLAELRALKLLLKKAREEALKVIYDPKIYLPEDDPRWRQGEKINGQLKVDELVEAVRQIWEQPARFVLGSSRTLERDLEEIRTINEKYFPAFGLEGDTEKDFAAFEEVRNNLNEALSIRSYCLNAAERQDYEWNRRVDRYNDSLKGSGITRDEIEHARTLNDYREMMGRRRLFLDARLCRATKKHSAACDKAGRIWHVGEDGDPNSRARAEGFTSGVSENVAIGYSSPADIWTRGWYRASDHHRNGLSDSWNCMGYGYVGSVGTQNFSAIGNPKGF